MSTPTTNAPISPEIVPEQSSPSHGTDVSSAQPAIESELLVEEISIDGMCGVY